MHVHAEGIKAEAAYAKDKSLPDPDSTDNPEFKIVLGLIKEGLPKTPQKWTNMGKSLRGGAPALCHAPGCRALAACTRPALAVLRLACSTQADLPARLQACLRRPPRASSACTRCRRAIGQQAPPPPCRVPGPAAAVRLPAQQCAAGSLAVALLPTTGLCGAPWLLAASAQLVLRGACLAGRWLAP